MKLFLLIHFAYIFNVFVDVEGEMCGLLFAVPVYGMFQLTVLWPDDEPSLGSKIFL